MFFHLVELFHVMSGEQAGNNFPEIYFYF